MSQEENNSCKGSSDALAVQLHKCEQAGVAERILDQFASLLMENCDIADLVNKNKAASNRLTVTRSLY